MNTDFFSEKLAFDTKPDTVKLQPAAAGVGAAEEDDDDDDDDDATPAADVPVDAHDTGSSSRDTDRPNTVAMLSSTDALACVCRLGA